MSGALQTIRQIPEELLNETVWSAIESVFLNPDLLIKQCVEFQAGQVRNAETANSQIQDAERGLKQIEIEESRLLEGYRLGVISAGHLGQELEKLMARKNALDTQRSASAEKQIASPQVVKRSIEEFCREAAVNISQFDHKEKQQFLRLLLKEILFEGSRVRIRGSIPLNRESQSAGVSPSGDAGDLSDRSRIATTMVSRRELNPAVGSAFDLKVLVDKPARPMQPRDQLGRFFRKSWPYASS